MCAEQIKFRSSPVGSTCERYTVTPLLPLPLLLSFVTSLPPFTTLLSSPLSLSPLLLSSLLSSSFFSPHLLPSLLFTLILTWLLFPLPSLSSSLFLSLFSLYKFSPSSSLLFLSLLSSTLPLVSSNSYLPQPVSNSHLTAISSCRGTALCKCWFKFLQRFYWRVVSYPCRTVNIVKLIMVVKYNFVSYLFHVTLTEYDILKCSLFMSS